MEASVRVAGNGYGTGRVRQGQAYRVPKMELRFEDRRVKCGVFKRNKIGKILRKIEVIDLIEIEVVMSENGVYLA